MSRYEERWVPEYRVVCGEHLTEDCDSGREGRRT